MECRDVLPMLSAYADGELRGGERLRVKDHLAFCPCCAKQMEALQALQTGLQESMEEPVDLRDVTDSVMSNLPARRRTITFSFPWRWAAVAAACVVVGLLGWRVFLFRPQVVALYPGSRNWEGLGATSAGQTRSIATLWAGSSRLEILADESVHATTVPTGKPLRAALTFKNETRQKIDAAKLGITWKSGRDFKLDVQPDEAPPASVAPGESIAASFRIVFPKEAAGQDVTVFPKVEADTAGGKVSTSNAGIAIRIAK
jgi:hypothetical protein